SFRGPKGPLFHPWSSLPPLVNVGMSCRAFKGRSSPLVRARIWLLNPLPYCHACKARQTCYSGRVFNALPMKSLAEIPAVRVARRAVMRRIVFTMLILITAFLGTVAGLLIVYSTDLPQISDLERYRPSTITELYDAQGRQIGSFALQRRVLAAYNDFPKVLH